MRRSLAQCSLVRITEVVALIVFVTSCVGDGAGNGDVSPGETQSSTLCGTQLSATQDSSSNNLIGIVDVQPSTTPASSGSGSLNYGDGSDGEFYLASGDTFYLEEKTYNYSNVYLESGSTLTMLDDVANGTGEITINSLGSCYFLGEIHLDAYRGTLNIKCDGEIVLGGDNYTSGSLDIGTGSNSLSTDGATITTMSSSGDTSVSLSSGFGDTYITIPPNLVGTPISFDSSTFNLITQSTSTTINSAQLVTDGCQVQ